MKSTLTVNRLHSLKFEDIMLGYGLVQRREIKEQLQLFDDTPYVETPPQLGQQSFFNAEKYRFPYHPVSK